ncbi:zinc finger protein 184-like [Lineus longissimus]|uniref:zinc finger protein 184-like n=1 Tax=Lineus longissimus TaxID=88925 RepID=UPI00315D5147
MEEKTGTEALNVVIERLSEICSKTPDTDDVDNRSVGSQTPAVSVVPVQVNTIKSGNPGSSPKTSPTRKEAFKCDECDYSSHNKHYLKQHVDLVHSTDRPFKCPFCDYAGKRSYALKEHLIVHSNDRPFECTHCNATFRKKGHLTNHIKMHASQWNFDCSICHTSLPTRDALYEHVGKHAKDDGDVFACEQCLFATLDKSLICKHIESGTCSQGANTLKCDNCNFTSAKEEELAAHRATHNMEPSNTTQTVLLKCSECGFTSTEQDVLENHIINKHLNNMAPNTSKSISKSLHPPTVKDPVLAPKKKINTQPTVPKKSKNCEQMLCKICGITCENAQGLVQHMKSHSATQITPKRLVPNQSDNTCLNPDSAKFSYDAAMRIFRCSICGYTCEHQRTIKSHIWKHSGHKDVGYPMFQNGPLSIYDDLQGGVKTQELAKMTIVGKPPGGIQMEASAVMNTPDMKPMPVSAVPNMATASSSFPVATVSSANTTRACGIPILKNIRVSQAPITSSASTSGPGKAVVLPNSGNTVRSVGLNKLAFQSNAVLPGQVENGLNVISRMASSQDVTPDYPCAQVVVLNVDPTQLQSLLSEADMSNVVIVNQDMEEEKESHAEIVPKRKHEDLNNDDDEIDAKRSRDDFEVSEVGRNVVVEDVQDSCPMADLTLRGSPRVPVIEATSDASSVASEGVSPVPTDIPLVEPASESQDEVEVPMSDDQLTQSLVSVCEKAERAIVDKKTSDAKHQRSDELDGRPTPGQDILVVTNEASSVSRRTRSSTSGISRELRGSNKSGISSSLLAVIEQLRERSKSDSDHEESDPPPPCPTKVQPASRVTKRSRSKLISSEEMADIESFQNVEKLEHKTGIYRCKLCHYMSASTTLMLQHMRLHKSKKPFECSLCDFIAEASEALQDHMLQHCKIRTYQCKLCPSTFNYKSQLRAHMRAHNETEPFTCDVCEFETFNPIQFRNHAKTHKERYHCKDCNAAYTEKCEDENHEKEERSAGNLYCDECGLVLQSQDDLKKHQKSHIKQLRCEQCNFSCSTLGRMRNHCRLHLDDKPMQCNLCDFTAISTRSLKSHMKRHINDQRYVQQPLEQYKCNLCGYVCHHLPSLKSHMWRHASETGYSYQDANDAINAAIDYENNMNQPIKCQPEVAASREDTDDDTDADTENVQVIEHVKELLDTEKVVKVGVTREGKSDGSTLVTFRCCQCGFESISRVQLTSHMKQHADIISKTLEISQYKNHKKGTPLEAVVDVNEKK